MAQLDVHLEPFGSAGFNVYAGTAAPTSGTYGQGDWCIATTPTAGQPGLWVCTTGGSPGTWKAVNVAS